MTKGEKSLLTCKPEYAYGAAGSPPNIPPDSTLQFEVELLSWKSERDISPAGDGGIMKETLTEGTGWQRVKDDDEAMGEAPSVPDVKEQTTSSSHLMTISNCVYVCPH